MSTTRDTTTSRPGARGRVRLGEILVHEGLVSAQTLDSALAASASSGKRLGYVLLQSGAISDDQLAIVLARQLNIPFVDLGRLDLKPELARLLPEALARRHRAVALEDRGSAVLVGFADPLDIPAVDEIERIVKRTVLQAVCPEGQVAAALDRLYRRTDEIAGHAKALEKDLGVSTDTSKLGEDAKEEAPVVRMLQSVFEDAIQVRASDIHIEPQERALQIRFRIDGVLQRQGESDSRIAAALIQRLKLMAGLDIAEKRLPMDGRFSVKARDREIDVRMSTLPGQHGESVVLRLLDQSGNVRGLDGIGMPTAMVARLRAILGSGAGMVLASGPTGAGKTTTLYAALSEVDVVAQKVVTVEDPVEYRLPGIVQVQVNDKIDLTFARVLRSTLRQDPDVVLVGEMRDAETVEIGMRAALTGHLVLSTVHTLDAPSATVRLLDMGAPMYMVATCLRAVIAQRLVRLNCVHCSRERAPSAQERAWLMAVGGREGAQLAVKEGAGCAHCNGTGYRERTGLYEMFVMDEGLVKVAVESGASKLLAAARETVRGATLADAAFALVKEGRTSPAEAIRNAALGEE